MATRIGRRGGRQKFAFFSRADREKDDDATVGDGRSGDGAAGRAKAAKRRAKGRKSVGVHRGEGGGTRVAEEASRVERRDETRRDERRRRRPTRVSDASIIGCGGGWAEVWTERARRRRLQVEQTASTSIVLRIRRITDGDAKTDAAQDETKRNGTGDRRRKTDVAEDTGLGWSKRIDAESEIPEPGPPRLVPHSSVESNVAEENGAKIRLYEYERERGAPRRKWQIYTLLAVALYVYSLFHF